MMFTIIITSVVVFIILIGVYLWKNRPAPKLEIKPFPKPITKRSKLRGVLTLMWGSTPLIVRGKIINQKGAFGGRRPYFMSDPISNPKFMHSHKRKLLNNKEVVYA